jgi:type I restriction enzyme S subunit
MNDFFPETPFPMKEIRQNVTIHYGKGIVAKDRSPNGTVPVYGSNGIIGYHTEGITKSPCIIIGRKGSVGEVNFSECKCWPIDTSFFIDDFPKHIESKWLFYCLSHLDLGVHAQGPKPGIKRDLLYNTLIPIPEDINEQRRIVARIEELTRRAEDTRKTTYERGIELDILLQALYIQMINGVEWKPLEEVAYLVRRAVKTNPNEQYEEMGIRSFGKGTFEKPILTGKQIGNKRIYRIHEGDLVFNNVFSWEKAIAVAKKEDHGRVGSHRFISYVPHKGQATSEFLCHHFLSKRGIEDIRAASPGSAGRNRTLGLKKLEKILVPVPAYNEQKRFSEIVKRRQLIQAEEARIDDDLKAFYSALIAKAFRGEL